jgi:CRP-like cAMP-binding protein
MKTILETDKNFVCDINALCFQNLTPEEQNFIRSSKTQVHFRKGETLIKQGAYSSYILFIIEGLVKQYVEGNITHNFNTQILKEGDFIGLSAIFNNNTFSYSATALTPTIAFLIEKQTIATVMKRNGEFAYRIINRYCKQDVLLYDLIGKIMFKQMNGRVADALLYLDSETFADQDIFIRLSRKDIADFAGISTESAVKLLKSFEKDGIIKLEEKNIVITDRAKLLEISKKG